jgi:hypothetical protein
MRDSGALTFVHLFRYEKVYGMWDSEPHRQDGDFVNVIPFFKIRKTG